MWKTDKPVESTPSKLSRGPITLTVDDSGDQQYQSMILHFGVLSQQSREECLASWPREAIRLAREHLDRFEARMQEQGTHDADA